MEKHGSESYFVIGEGLLGETVGGRDRTLAAPDEAQVPPFRFSRMGPIGAQQQISEPTRRKIGDAMAAGGGGASPVPAGFTYLGHFVDHDLTCDKTKVMLAESALVFLPDGRSGSTSAWSTNRSVRLYAGR